ncbi:MAG TPA: hypothetical protein VLX92_07380 [Kofleriaceae bacterium]|nr:hypothetical protein [Kofleriaceae bacterium]
MSAASSCSFAVAVACAIGWSAPARADAPRPIVGFEVRGPTRVTAETLAHLSHVDLGDRVAESDLPEIELALLSSELFETVAVELVPSGDGVIVAATLHDRLPWIAAPALYVLPKTFAIGAGYAESDLFGEDKKLLVFGQIGNRESFAFATYMDPLLGGTHFIFRADVFPLRRMIDEYDNTNPRAPAIVRRSTETYLDGGLLLGYELTWWLVPDVRIRGARVKFRGAHAPDGTPLPEPERDGWDVSTQARITADHRFHDRGITWGAFAQALVESSVPRLDSYGYQFARLRAYYSWRLFGDHELELRSYLEAGRHLPFHEEVTLGSESDLRGYALEQLRGDARATFRAEYSVPLGEVRKLAFRGLGFWDSGYARYVMTDPSGMRDYLPFQRDGAHWWRNDVGAGFRIYVGSVVLPLVGVDVGYGLEGHSFEAYVELGLTDF